MKVQCGKLVWNIGGHCGHLLWGFTRHYNFLVATHKTFYVIKNCYFWNTVLGVFSKYNAALISIGE